MQIQFTSLLEGAREAKGTAIIIDVFRAFTTAAVALDRGAREIILVAEVEEAFELRRQGIADLCMGEVGGIKPSEFDLGNSPYELSLANLTGQVLVQSTRAGTVGVAAASQTSKIYLGSFVTAKATAKAVLQTSPTKVSIVAMGAEARVRTDEDEQCALYLRNLLEGRQPDPDAIRALVLAGKEAQKYGDPSQPQFHPRDKDLALQIDCFHFAIPVHRRGGLPIAIKEEA